MFQFSRNDFNKDSQNINHYFLNNDINDEEDKKNIKILNEPIDYSNIIITQSSFSLIRAIIERSIDFLFFDSLIFEIYFEIFLLFDYFLYSIMNLFIDKSIIQFFELKIDLNDVKKNEKYIYASDVLFLEENYKNFRKFYFETREKLKDLFQNNNQNNYKYFEYYLPKLINTPKNKKDIYETSYFYPILLSINSIKSTYEILKKITTFTEKLEFDFQKEIIIKTINKYEIIIKELQSSLYKRIYCNIINMNKIKEMSLSVNWNASETIAEKLLFEPSPFVKYTIEEIKNIYENIKNKLLEFDKKTQEEFIILFLKFIIQNIQESFSKIQKCSKSGRSIMLKDIKRLQNGISSLINKWNYDINLNELFKVAYDYVNSWYASNDALFNFIFDNVRKYFLFNFFIFRNWNINILMV